MKNILPKLKSYFQPSQFAGLSWELQAGGGKGQIVVLEKEKASINTIQKEVDIDGLEKLVTTIPQGVPVFLCVHGKGILQKAVSRTLSNPEQLLGQILPNAQANQFYVQQTPLVNGVLGNVIRKDSLDDLLEKLKEAGIWVTGVSIGLSITQFLQPFLQQNPYIELLSHQLQFNEQGEFIAITSQVGEERTYQLGEENWSNKSLPAYAAAFCGIMQIPTGLSTTSLSFQQEEFFYQQVFEKGKKIAAGLVLGVLLLNTFAYYFYKDKNKGLQGQLVQTKAILSELDSLKVKVNRQQDLFQTTGINQQSQTSYYADRIGASLPKGLQLTELLLFPMDGNERDYDENSLRRYRQNEIRIKGVCKSSLTYNQWIKDLAQLTWVEEARHLNYKDLSKKRGEFELQIIIGPSR